MLLGMYNLYHNSAKKWREFKHLADIYHESVVKIVRSHGSRWAAHKLSALRAVVKDYCTLISHLEDLTSGERPDVNGADACRMKGYLKTLKSLKFLFYCHLFVDIFEQLAKMSLIFQSDSTMVYRIADQLDSTIAGLVLLKSVDGSNIKLFKQNISIDEKENTCTYNKLVTFKLAGQSIARCDNHKAGIIDATTSCIEKRFESLDSCPVISKSGTILNCQLWPRQSVAALAEHGNNEMSALSCHFQEILTANGCVIDRILPEWVQLKRYLKRNWQARFTEKRGGVNTAWQIIFETEGNASSEFVNVLHLVQILLVMPVASACVE